MSTDLTYLAAEKIFDEIIDKHKVRFSDAGALSTEKFTSVNEIYILLKKGWSKDQISKVWEFTMLPMYPLLRNLN